MKASRALDEKNQEPTKPPTIRTKPHRAGQERPQNEGFVPFVGESRGSHILKPGDPVTYTIPQPDSNKVCPEWVEHSGIVLQVDPVGQMVLIRPEDESGTPWRWVAWCYAKKANDGEA